VQVIRVGAGLKLIEPIIRHLRSGSDMYLLTGEDLDGNGRHPSHMQRNLEKISNFLLKKSTIFLLKTKLKIKILGKSDFGGY
jgi:hypothetical protein